MDVLSSELIAEVASYMGEVDEAHQLFLACKAMASVRLCKRAFALFLHRRSGHRALDDLAKALCKHRWGERHAVAVLRQLILISAEEPQRGGNQLAIEAAARGFTQVSTSKHQRCCCEKGDRIT